MIRIEILIQITAILVPVMGGIFYCIRRFTQLETTVQMVLDRCEACQFSRKELL